MINLRNYVKNEKRSFRLKFTYLKIIINFLINFLIILNYQNTFFEPMTNDYNHIMNTKSILLSIFAFALLISNFSVFAQTTTPGASNTIKCSRQFPFNVNQLLTSEESLYLKPYLNRLDIYQNNCNSQAFTKLMLFTYMPTDDYAITNTSNRMSSLLKGMYKIGLKPIVIIEPGNINFTDFSNGLQNVNLVKMFNKMKSQGVTEQMMGLWVPFPEPNIPVWNNAGTTPATLVKCFNVFMGNLRQVFPSVKGSVLINSKSYAPEDKNWTAGSYSSLAGYGTGLNPEYLDSIGIQGFPWIGPRNVDWGYDKLADKFLPTALTVEFAKAAKTSNVWFNTGTFSSKYTLDPAKKITIPSSERKDTLNSILSQAKNVKDNLGYQSTIMINLFAEDKSTFAEATNWTFSTSQDMLILKNFIISANSRGYKLGYFDFKN